MSLTWGQIKSLIDKEVQDNELVACIEMLEGDQYVDVTYSARKKEVEIYGTSISPESR